MSAKQQEQHLKLSRTGYKLRTTTTTTKKRSLYLQLVVAVAADVLLVVIVSHTIIHWHLGLLLKIGNGIQCVPSNVVQLNHIKISVGKKTRKPVCWKKTKVSHKSRCVCRKIISDDKVSYCAHGNKQKETPTRTDSYVTPCSKVFPVQGR